ncbi:MAG: hypothetical protein WAV08_14285 [Desulfobacterales bacterium]|jgi:hypothetical protein|nr:hypothetical protein [Desulfobacterales bacterium]MDZ7597761.1 hypothetical protein [Desulfobacterales bacterium]
MYDKDELCTKIREIYPQIGACGIDTKVAWSEEKKAWAVDLEYKGKRVRHYLEDQDASACMEGEKCVALGIDIGQLL